MNKLEGKVAYAVWSCMNSKDIRDVLNSKIDKVSY